MEIRNSQIDGTTIIELKCNNTVSISASRFKNHVLKFLAENSSKLVLDFSKTKHVDSSMLGAILFISREVRSSGLELRLVKSKFHGHIWSLLELKNIYDNLKTFDDVDDAISYDTGGICLTENR
jgi:hypothetical protein